MQSRGWKQWAKNPRGARIPTRTSDVDLSQTAYFLTISSTPLLLFNHLFRLSCLLPHFYKHFFLCFIFFYIFLMCFSIQFIIIIVIFLDQLVFCINLTRKTKQAQLSSFLTIQISTTDLSSLSNNRLKNGQVAWQFSLLVEFVPVFFFFFFFFLNG